VSSAGAAQQPEGHKKTESFTTVASNISEIAAAGLTPLDIDILGWTSDAENERLMTAFSERGQAGLIEAMQKAAVAAKIRSPGSLALDFRYARQIAASGGTRRILLLADRWIGFGEAVNRTRSMDYPFTLIDMTVDSSGRGEGTLFIATKVVRTGNLLVLENFVSTPVTLADIKRKK
jgi:hypothetical protein